jgi:DNA-binding MarR family transcriptional regulator
MEHPLTLTQTAPHPLAALPGFALRRAAHAMMSALAEDLASIELKISDASVLLLVDGRDDMTSSRIGDLLDIQRANMVPLLARLESAGLIAREPLDRRSSAIVLTDEGKVRHQATLAIIDRFEQSLLARIPAQHRDHFIPALNALID